MATEAQTDTKSEQGQEQGAAAKDEPMLPQSKVNAILADERRKALKQSETITAEYTALKERLASIEAEKQAAEEAKLSATQRAELERKREREGYEKRIGELDTLSKTEREKRHALLIKSAAAGRVASVASRLFNPALSDVVTREVSQLLRVEDDGQGNERVVVVMGAEGDREPLETAWSKIEAERLAPFFKAAGGAGAAHGSGPASGRVSWADLSPTDKIAAGLQGRRTG